MNYYKIYGKRLVSDYELPQLVAQTKEETLLSQDITIKAGIFPEELKQDKDCWSEIKKPVSLLSNPTCWLYVTADEIIYELKKDTTTPQYLNSYLLGWGLTMLFWERGEPAIHCSCVYDKKGAVIISGNSGCGKSTVTSYFLDKGYGLVADDISVVQLRDDGAYATPCFPAQKFCRDVVNARNLNPDDLIYINEDKDKFLVPYKGNFPSEPVKVRCMIVLQKANVPAPKLDEVKGLPKFLTCLNSLFLKPLLRDDLNNQENAVPMLKMASYFPVYTLVRPEEGDTKKEVLELLKTLI